MVEAMKGVHVIDLSDSEISSLEVFLLDCGEGLILIDAGVKQSDLDLIARALPKR